MSLIQRALEQASQSKQTEPRGHQETQAPDAHKTVSLDTFLTKPTDKLPPKIEKSKRGRLTSFILLSVFALGVMGFVSLITLFFLPSSNSSSEKVIAPVTFEDVIQQPAAATGKVERALKKPVGSFPLIKKDVPVAATPEPAPQPYKLTGITDLGASLMAVINNELYGIGDAVAEDVVITEITTQRVVLDELGEAITLSL